MSQTILFLLLKATFATLYMVFVSGLIASLLGVPLGILLYSTRKNHILSHPLVYQVLAMIVNIMRSIPFIILMITIIPLTRLIVGTSIGLNAAIVPLSLAAMPFVARITENALLEVNKGLIEAATSMGATSSQIIFKVLLPESMGGIINGLTLMVINLIGFSAMAGAIGAGGLGDVAIRYGYQRFNVEVMLMTIFIMIILVQLIQWLGDRLSRLFLPPSV